MPARLLALLIWLAPAVAFAQVGLDVIELRYRSAQDLLPLLQPLVAPEGSVSALDNRLVVRATPAQMTQVRRLLDTFDRPPRQLLITVRQGSVIDSHRQAAGVSGVYRRGDGAIVVPRADGSLPSQVEVELQNQHHHSDSSGSQQLRVEEGREAQIELGRSVPYTTSYRTPGGGIVQRTESHSTGTGFTVLPRVQGQRVHLEISVKQQVPVAGGVINVQNASSVVSGALGEWFDIGGAVQQITQSGSSLLGGGQSSSRREGSILVKVEEVP